MPHSIFRRLLAWLVLLLAAIFVAITPEIDDRTQMAAVGDAFFTVDS